VLNQALVSLTGDAWIEDGGGNRAFAVDGSLLSLRGTHVLKDLGGHPLYEISKPLAPHLHRTISITRGGQAVATAPNALFNLAGDKFRITLADGQALAVRGDWMNREFQVLDQAGQLVMTASRAWFTIHNGYGIQISPAFEVPLGLAVVIALARRGRRARRAVADPRPARRLWLVLIAARRRGAAGPCPVPVSRLGRLWTKVCTIGAADTSLAARWASSPRDSARSGTTFARE